MKYCFKIDYEIKNCEECPLSFFRHDFHYNQIGCGLTGIVYVFKEPSLPENCPLEKCKL